MNLKNLETEQRNPRTMHIDSMSTLDMVRTVNQEDAAVTKAVETALPDIARLIDGICERLQNGGSLSFLRPYNPIAASSSCSLYEMSRQLLLDIQLSRCVLGSP